MDSEEEDERLNFDGISTKLEDKCIDEFVERFVIISETSTLGEVNLILALKALPIEIMDQNIYQHEILNFAIF